MNRAKTMIAIKVLVQSTIVPAVSVYKAQCDLNDNKKDHFYDNLIDVAGMIGKREGREFLSFAQPWMWNSWWNTLFKKF